MGDYQATLDRLLQLPLIAEILGRLRRELDPKLSYHSPQHSLDVLSDALRFACHDGLSARDCELLAIAAAYHDAGYLERYKANEPIGAAMAAAAMQSTGSYTADEIRLVEQMILSTQIGAGPMATSRKQHTPLAAYLMDADWGAFGREDFFEKNQQLVDETGADAQAFFRQSLELVKSQRWLTPGATALREAQKQKNIRTLEAQLQAVKSC